MVLKKTCKDFVGYYITLYYTVTQTHSSNFVLIIYRVFSLTNLKATKYEQYVIRYAFEVF